MTSENIFASYPSDGTELRSLPELCTALLDEQKSSWSLLRKGWEALESTTMREIPCKDFSIKVQYNPGRIVSTGAQIDDQSIRRRKCFLCPEHRPPEQKAVLYHDAFLILANPIPIFRQHFTVAHTEHTPQVFESHIDEFLMLAAELSPLLTLFYNGPRCGASAPDHMHFQACSSGVIPIERDIIDPTHKIHLRTLDGVTLSTIKNYGRGVIVLESGLRHNCALALHRLMNVIKELCNETEEPMMNVLGSFNEGIWRIIVFPRRKHRPSSFFVDDRIVISPAAVDMGGIIITPVEKDYRNMETSLIESIYHEVSVSAERIQSFIDKM